jgi:uncharacterized membrane protein
MKVKGLLIASVIVAAVMAAFAVYSASLVPAGAQLPTHWGIDGQPDRTQPALRALLLPAGISLLISLAFAAVPWIDPLQDKLKASAPVLRASWIGLMGLMVLVQWTVAAPIYGFDVGTRPIVLGLGVLFLVIGNVLPKSRPGFFVGIRTPWTITDTDIWIATNRLGGKLMMLAGALVVVAGLLPVAEPARFAVLIVSVTASALAPVVYSWWLWHRKKSAGA